MPTHRTGDPIREQALREAASYFRSIDNPEGADLLENLADGWAVRNGQCPGCPCGWNGPHPADPAQRAQEWTDYGTGAGWPLPDKPTT